MSSADNGFFGDGGGATPQAPNALQILTSAVKSIEAAADHIQRQLGLSRRQFRALAESVTAINEGQGDWECLDVGGTCFHAGCGVLGSRGAHFLSVLVSKEFPSERGSEGCIFIDRDPEHFPLVLQYLRDGSMLLPQERAALRCETRFYGLPDFDSLKSCLLVLPLEGGAVHAYESGAWQRLPSVVAKHSHFSLAFWNQRWAVVRACGTVYVVETLDPTSCTWQTLPRFAVDLFTSPQLVTVGSQLFCNARQAGQVVVLDGDEGRWAALPTMAQPRVHYGICAMGDGLVVVGGRTARTFSVLRSVERFCCRLQRWAPLPDMMEPRVRPGVAMWRGKLVVVGGCRGYCCPLNSVEAYDPLAGTWHTMPPVRHARDFPSVVVYEGSLIVVSGLGSGFTLVDEVEQYDAEAQAWRVIHTIEGAGRAAVGPYPDNCGSTNSQWSGLNWNIV